MFLDVSFDFVTGCGSMAFGRRYTSLPISSLMAILFGIGKLRQYHHRLRHIRFVPTKSSDFRAVKIHGKTELDALHDASVAPTLRVNLHALDEAVHEGLFLQIGELVVQLVEVEQELIDVVGGNPVLTDVVHAGLHLGDADLDGGDLVVDPVLALLQILQPCGCNAGRQNRARRFARPACPWCP